MMKHIFLIAVALFVCLPSYAQVPMATQIQILKAEDARRYDKTLEDLLKSPNEQVRIRAALAAGRPENYAPWADHREALAGMVERVHLRRGSREHQDGPGGRLPRAEPPRAP